MTTAPDHDDDAYRSFLASRTADAPPQGLSAPLLALWWDAKGHWDEAHGSVQDANGPNAAWVHAYLHRKEGDPGNAGYWYRLAGRGAADGPLDAEWEAIARALLGAFTPPRS